MSKERRFRLITKSGKKSILCRAIELTSDRWLRKKEILESIGLPGHHYGAQWAIYFRENALERKKIGRKVYYRPGNHEDIVKYQKQLVINEVLKGE